MKSRCYFMLIVFMSLLLPVAAQIPSADTTSFISNPNFYNMTLEQLMGLEVTVASKQSLTTRESPGVVSMITEEEIKSSGARNLMDILRLVPGFDFCVDVQGVVGISVRGNWANEGKALLLIDGLEMNENLYSTLQFGNHYPVHNIKRIEIIRGPGSAIYGGNAEYAVINIISKSASELNGGEAMLNYGQLSATPGHYSASLAAGNQYKDFGFSVAAYTGHAVRSDRRYTDFWEGTYDMAEHSDLKSNHINVGMHYKKLQFRGIIDKYSVDTKDNYDKVLEGTYRVRFDTYIGELKQDIQINPKLVVTPRANVKMQLPWRYSGAILNDEFISFYIKSSRYTGGINTAWTPTSKINVIGGVEYFCDNAVQQSDQLFISTGTKYLDYNNTSVYTQASFKTRLVDITAGARYNYNDRFASSFVPRLSVTRVFDRLHFKVLYSEAYRTPNTENIDLNSSIAPERTTVIEFEAGMKILPTMYITGNLYDITTKDPILYFYDINTDQDGYRNASRTGTRGVELDLQWKFHKGYLDCSYEYYTAAGKNSLIENSVPGDKHAMLGISNHQITLSAHYQLGKKYSINPSGNFLGKRYGVVDIDSLEQPVIDSFDPVCLLNLTFRAEEVLFKGLSLGISVYNILDQRESFLQPYKGGHAELPGLSREFVLNITYRFIKK